MIKSQQVFFQGWISFVITDVQNQGQTTDFHLGFCFQDRQFVHGFGQGQRNPLNDWISSFIWDKISFCIIIINMITISFGKSINNCIVWKNMIKSVL